MKQTQMIEVGKCISNKFQPRSRNSRGIEGLARNMRVNGQLTPITVVSDGEAYQVVFGHRRLAASKMNGEKWIEAYVERSWEDAAMARKLTAENCNREAPTAGEQGEAIQTMLSLGVPVTQVAASADTDVTKVRDFARGAELVPGADGSCDFDALVCIGEHRDVLDEDDIAAIMAAGDPWNRESVCRKATGRANRARLAAELERQGVRVVDYEDIDGATMRWHDGEGGRAGLLAVITSNYHGEARATFYRELGEEELAAEAAERARAEAEAEARGEEAPGPEPGPTPEAIEAEARYQSRLAAYADLEGHVAEFARGIYSKFPGGKGHSKLRAWAHAAFDRRFGEPGEAWRGVRKPKSGALDRFVLMRTVPGCLPRINTLALRDGFEPRGYEAEAIGEFLHFHDEVLAFARYRATEEEAELLSHLRSLIAPGEPEPEARGDGRADGGECPIVALAERIVSEAAEGVEALPAAA